MNTYEQKTATRPDLARELLDEGKRRAFLHPNERTMLGSLKRMYEPVKKNPRIIMASIGYALTSGVLPLLSVLVTYILVQMLSSPNQTPGRMFMAAGIYGAVYFICSGLSHQLEMRNYSWFNLERMKMIHKVNYQLMRMDFGLYENPTFMDDLETATYSLSSNDQGFEGTYHKIFQMGGTFVSALLLALLLGWLNPLIAFVGVFFVIVTFLVQSHVGDFKYKRREELMRIYRQIGMLNHVAADFKAGKDLRLYRVASRFKAVFDPILKANTLLYKAFTRREFELSFVESVALIAIDLVSAIVLVQQRMAGAIDTAQFVMLLSAVILFSQTMLLLGQQLSAVKTETLYVQDMYDMVNADLNTEFGSNVIPGDGPIDVTFEDVSFSYPGTDRLVLEHLNFTIPAGERVALVGLNGAGKTTLVKLLLGLYQPDSGRILINGIDSSTLSYKALFSLFGVVFQEADPIALTIAETVAASVDNIDRERVEACLKTAGLWQKVESFAKGIDTPLLKIIDEDGAILSGGENQKLMIARALYREGTRMMVMDEPTAALDALAEQKIYQEFDKLLRGRTALFISHRLASTRFCDRILLLDGGHISQAGTHDELIAQEGLYKTLFTTQGKYYQEENDDEK
ncbi:MAG TPA: ABC transporter ATP-binding protein [Fastidiosipila sp.]|nr:ABC transporter ATP-binding protein [Fastidiosipila sp.]